MKPSTADKAFTSSIAQPRAADRFAIATAPPSLRWSSRMGAALTLAVTLALPLTPSAARADGQVRSFGSYTLRSNTVASEDLPKATAHAYGIERDARNGVLHVAVLKKHQGVERTVRANVKARVLSRVGDSQEVSMRAVEVGERVSYMGTYATLGGQALDITIVAVPEGTEKLLTMSYKDRVPPP